MRTLTPKTIDEDKKDKIIYYIHGGGYVFGDGVAGTLEGTLMAAFNNYRVVAVDYRLAPQHPYPAAIDDASRSTGSSSKNTARRTSRCSAHRPAAR